MKPQDNKAAAEVRFGIEIETAIPRTSQIAVGGYHRGTAVTSGRILTGQTVQAPAFNGNAWMAERDGSIACDYSQEAAEFVSPILHGESGVQNVADFVSFIKACGARVNDSCGVHVTISVDSIIGSSDNQARAEFAQKLAHIAQWHSRSIYGQTGTGRHLNRYSHTLSEAVATHARTMKTETDLYRKMAAANACGRGMVNFQKLFSKGVIEFRAFAGTTNIHKILHHIATAIGLCRRAHEVKQLGGFKKNKVQIARTRTAKDALVFLHDYLGWTGSKRDCALGLFGLLYTNFSTYRQTAARLCEQFDARFPNANL
jgi:hypothetical protein